MHDPQNTSQGSNTSLAACGRTSNSLTDPRTVMGELGMVAFSLLRLSPSDLATKQKMPFV
jgi:hypothetical protein